MKRCGRCGKFTYHNSHFNREVCPYCGWMESTSDNLEKVVTIRKQNTDLIRQFTVQHLVTK